VDDACGGTLQSTITCQRCQHASHCFDPFLDLSVPMPKRKSAVLSTSSDVDLHACLRTFTETETLDGRDKYMCVKCKSPQPATKRLSIYSFPTILIVHMKRFASSGGGVMSRLVSHQKDSTPVRFDREGLDLSAYASPAVRSRRAVYDLYAVSNHSGSLGGGHYTAVAKHLKDDQWCAPIPTPHSSATFCSFPCPSSP
jgi:ubiquitin C-terminal hydrolase